MGGNTYILFEISILLFSPGAKIVLNIRIVGSSQNSPPLCRHTNTIDIPTCEPMIREKPKYIIFFMFKL